MRVVIAIPHYWKIGRAGRFGSTRSDKRTRIEAVAACLDSIRTTFCRSSYQSSLRDTHHFEANHSTSIDVHIIMCVHAKDHLLNDLRPVIQGVEVRFIEDQPSLLGFACHKVLAEELGGADFFGYLEDDIILRDTAMFAKLTWFSSAFGQHAVLQPNRYEISGDGRNIKVYIDGELDESHTKRFQDISIRQEVRSKYLDGDAFFRRVTNPHSGCFFLNADQMRNMSERDSKVDSDGKFFSSLEEAATLDLMRSFLVYKPSPQNASFLEVQHFGDEWIRKIERRDRRLGATSAWRRSNSNTRSKGGGMSKSKSISTAWAMNYRQHAFHANDSPPTHAQIANSGLLKAFARNATNNVVYCVTPSERDFREFNQTLNDVTPKRRNVCWLDPTKLSELRNVNALMHPGMDVGRCAWQRKMQTETDSFSVVGIAHAVASHGAMDVIGSLSLAPVRPWDALVCTSKSLKSVIEHVLGEWRDYLASEFNVNVLPTIKLPVIPLGADCREIAKSLRSKESLVNQTRSEWGISPEEVVFLYFCRTSLTNPVPMLQALQQTASSVRPRLRLLFVCPSESARRRVMLARAAERFCPSVRASIHDVGSVDVMRRALAVADVFTALPDSIHETFDCAVIEAMAAELPVVVSDWSYMRDIVRDRVDGFRIPSLLISPGAGGDLAARYETGVDSYDSYLSDVAQSVSIEPRQLVASYVRLAKNPTLRRQMGMAARARAIEKFDWSVVIAQYEELFESLRQDRVSCGELCSTSRMHPLRGDPFTIFSGYSTHPLSPHMHVQIDSRHALLNDLCADPVANPAGRVSMTSMSRLVGVEGSVAELTGASDSNTAKREIGWLLKYGAASVRTLTDSNKNATSASDSSLPAVVSSNSDLWKKVELTHPVNSRSLAGWGIRGLHCGCGSNIQVGWLNSDVEFPNQALKEIGAGEIYQSGDSFVLRHDATRPYPIEDATFDWVYSEHFIEHLTLDDGVAWLVEIRRLLKTNGLLRISTPDLEKYASCYVTQDESFFMKHASRLKILGVKHVPTRPAWMINQILRNWGHKWTYDFDELVFALEVAGFSKENIRRRVFRQGSVVDVAQLDMAVRNDESVYVEVWK